MNELPRESVCIVDVLSIFLDIWCVAAVDWAGGIGVVIAL